MLNGYRHVRDRQNCEADQVIRARVHGRQACLHQYRPVLLFCHHLVLVGGVWGHPSEESLKGSWRNSELPLAALWVLSVSPASGCEISRQSLVDFHQEENSCQESLKLCHSGGKINTNNLTDITDLEESPMPSLLRPTSYVSAFTQAVKENGNAAPPGSKLHPHRGSLLSSWHFLLRKNSNEGD